MPDQKMFGEDWTRAWQRLCAGFGTKEDARLVLDGMKLDLMRVSGGLPDACALSQENGRRLLLSNLITASKPQTEEPDERPDEPGPDPRPRAPAVARQQRGAARRVPIRAE